MFREEEIYLDQDFSSQEELFKAMSQIFIKKGLVRDDYLEALKEREASFPTGLPNQVAIPHLSGEYAKDNLIVYVRLKNPLPFVEMGSEDQWTDVRHVFFLIFQEGDGHIGALTQIINMIQNEEQLAFLEEAQNPQEVSQYLNQILERKD